MSNKITAACTLFGAVAITLAACGGDSNPTEFDPNAGDGGSSNTDGRIEIIDPINPDSGTKDGSPNLCAATKAEVKKPPVDIIFVIDNSGSMTAEMTQIKTNINSFASKIGTSGLDYRVLVMVQRGTGGLQLCVPAPLGTANCGDNLPTFRHIAQSVGSTNALTLLLSTYDSANAALSWKGNLRQEAYKVFIAITDDQSQISSATFDTALLAKAPAGMFGTAANRKYIFHSIVGWKDGTAVNSATACDTSENTGSVYQELSILTKGIVDSVCKASYAGVFDKLADGINSRLGCELGVPSAAASDPKTLVVQYTSAPGAVAEALTQVTDVAKCGAVPNAWYYDNNATPTKVLLCPTTCTRISAVAGGKVDALVGCPAPDPK